MWLKRICCARKLVVTDLEEDGEDEAEGQLLSERDDDEPEHGRQQQRQQPEERAVGEIKGEEWEIVGD